MAFMFEKLEVYQKAVDFADLILPLTEQFPRGYGFLADQLNRASLSISTNLAECNGRFTKADRLPASPCQPAAQALLLYCPRCSAGVCPITGNRQAPWPSKGR